MQSYNHINNNRSDPFLSYGQNNIEKCHCLKKKTSNSEFSENIQELNGSKHIFR